MFVFTLLIPIFCNDQYPTTNTSKVMFSISSANVHMKYSLLLTTLKNIPGFLGRMLMADNQSVVRFT